MFSFFCLTERTPGVVIHHEEVNSYRIGLISHGFGWFLGITIEFSLYFQSFCPLQKKKTCVNAHIMSYEAKCVLYYFSFFQILQLIVCLIVDAICGIGSHKKPSEGTL